MKKIKKLLLVAFLVMSATFLYSQSGITIEASQQYTSFKFTDSQGSDLAKDYTTIPVGAYSLGYRYISDGGFIISTGIGMRNAGANMGYDNSNYSWKLQYGAFKAGPGYMFKINNLNPYINVSGYLAYLLNGIQTLNNEDYNIIDSEGIERLDFGVVFSPGVELKISDFLSGFLELNYLLGLKDIETNENQKTTNYAYSVSLGLSFNFIKQ